MFYFVFLVSCDCYCSVALPYSAVGWYAVCDCGFPDNTQLLFWQTVKAQMKCRIMRQFIRGLHRFYDKNIFSEIIRFFILGLICVYL